MVGELALHNFRHSAAPDVGFDEDVNPDPNALRACLM